MPTADLSPGFPDSSWVPVAQRLEALGVPVRLVSDLQAKLAGTCRALLLYGSWARGDADEHSDLDVLAVDYSGAVPRQGGDVSLSFYSENELRDSTGTLFGHHLSRDGVILYDREGVLASVLPAIRPPGPGTVQARIRSLSAVLDVPDQDTTTYMDGLTKVARYLLRSALYAQALDSGAPCYSVREIAQRRAEPELEAILSSHGDKRPPATRAVLRDLTARLTDAVGGLAANPFGSLHDLIEGAWDENRELSNFAVLCLPADDDELPYDELPKVVL
jgi:hypothetical protein